MFLLQWESAARKYSINRSQRSECTQTPGGPSDRILCKALGAAQPRGYVSQSLGRDGKSIGVLLAFPDFPEAWDGTSGTAINRDTKLATGRMIDRSA